MSFALYLFGYIVFISGVGYGLDLLGVSHQWMIVVLLILGGLGITHAVMATRHKDPVE